jgi:coenzyme F420-dependent glucose-6-phosphate dehydrogenase
MAAIGYTLSSEEHGPRDLVKYAGGAEQAGFDFASISARFEAAVADTLPFASGLR